MSNLLPNAMQQFFGPNGVPLSGGSVYYYIPNTTTFKSTYQDQAQTILNTNPIILDANGECVAWGTGAYRQQVFDVNNNLIWDKVTQDPQAALLGNMTDAVFSSGTGFTPGVTTSLTLPTAPSSIGNMWVFFDGTFQNDQSIASLNGTVVTFTSPIPVGVSVVEVKIGTTVAIGTPGSGTVNDSSVAQGTALANRLNYFLTVKDPQFGALGDGATNDTAAFASTNNVSEDIYVPPGTYLINSNVTLNNNFIFQQGSVLNIATGVTVTFQNGIQSIPQKIFNCIGTGAVAFNKQFQTVGYPEWWGAVTNSSSADCAPAINACIVALPITQLQAAQYYTASQVTIATSNRSLLGTTINVNNLSAAHGSQIVLKTSTGDVLSIGTAANPGSINQFVTNITVKNVQVIRPSGPTPPTAPNNYAGPAGVRLQYTLYTSLEFVDSEESSIGFVMGGTVQTKLSNCSAFRSLAGTSSTNDIFFGFYQNGAINIGTAGGNASTYYTDCLSVVQGSPNLTTPIGLLLDQSPVDTFIHRFESSNVGTGIQVNGSNMPLTDQDVHIISCVLDAFSTNGIFLNGMGGYCAVNISDCYAAPSGAATSTSNAIAVNACLGTVSISGCQVYGAINPASGGIVIEGNTAGVVTSGNMWNGCIRPVAILSSSDVSMSDIINFPVAQPSGNAAIFVQGASRCVIDTVVKGTSGAIPHGIWLDTTTVTASEFRMSKVDAGCIIGGSANKLLYNGNQVTSTGTFGTNNLAQGIMV